MKLIVGLGNPGAEYERNRHNVGFMALERIYDDFGTSPWKRKFQAQTSDAKLAGERALLIKPQTYMNESGRSVGEAARFLKVPPEDVIVIYDEIDLAPGKLKTKTGGGNAGHNGLRSISAHIGNDYVRVRIGVGHPGDKSKVASYVLKNFAKAEHVWLDPLIVEISRAAPRLMANDQSRFLTDVVTALAPPKPQKQKPKPETNDGGEKTNQSPKAADNKQSEQPQAASGTALAENLKAWLKGGSDKT